MKKLISVLLVLCMTLAFLPIVSTADEASFGKVEYWRLILKEDIGIHFQIAFSDAILADENAKIAVETHSDTQYIPVSQAKNGLNLNVAPAQMTDRIGLSIISGQGVIQELGFYSVKAYADEILGGNYDNATKKMVKAMLTYGGASQNYFAYNSDNPANADVDFPLAAMPAAEQAAVNMTGKAVGMTFYGASLCYDSQIALRYYFWGGVDGCTLKVNGRTLQPLEKDGLSYVEVTGILPQELADYFLLTAKDAQGNTLNITYRPLDYIIRMYHKEDVSQDTKDLLHALYTYHLTAQSYSH